MIKPIGSIAVLLAMSACMHVVPQNGMPTPAQTFYHIAPVAVPVDRKEITINPMRSETDFSFPLDDMVFSYFERKLNPVGGRDTIHVVLEEASVSSQDQGGMIGLGGHDVYNVSMRVRLEYQNDVNDVIKGKMVTIARTITVSKHASIAMRERAQLEGVEAMFSALDTWVDGVISENS